MEEWVRELPWYCVVTGLMTPALGRAFIEDAKKVARLRAAVAALAVERFRLVNGALPEKLEDLVPACIGALPADPFIGKPLRYKKLEKGYIIYSVGENERDDGGREKAPRGSPSTDTDVTFTVER